MTEIDSRTETVSSSRSAVPSQRAVEQQDENDSFGPPPLIEGEDATWYKNMHSSISNAVKPTDFIEEIWVRDVVDLSWECLRMRRLKATLITAAMSNEIYPLLMPLMESDDALDLSSQWKARDRQAMENVDQYLRKVGSTMETVTARAMSKNIDKIERMDRMIMSAEVRRNAALREMERRRSGFAEALRRASDDAVEAEYEEVAPALSGEEEVA